MVNALASPLDFDLMATIHRLQKGYLGYLILFPGQTFVYQRQSSVESGLRP